MPAEMYPPQSPPSAGVIKSEKLYAHNTMVIDIDNFYLVINFLMEYSNLRCLGLGAHCLG